MPAVLISLVIGLAVGVVSARTRQLVGVIAAVAAVVAWFVGFVLLRADGISSGEAQSLGLSLVAGLVGFFVGRMALAALTVRQSTSRSG